MREKQIERKLTKAVVKRDGLCLKLISPSLDGLPDRLVLLPHGSRVQGGKIGFVEVKAPGEKPRPLQTARHTLLTELGFKVYVLDGEEQIGGILDEIQSS